MKRIRLVLGLSAIALMVSACAPRLMALGTPVYASRFEKTDLAMPDGARLPLRIWEAKDPHAILIGLHGFNDYSNAFAMPGAWFAARGISVYAYDQRGFGNAPGHRLWAGTARMTDDLTHVVALLRARHRGLPIYLIGESMGGAVIMVAMGKANPPPVDGVILAAPAVWGWHSMNTLYDTVLWVSAHTVPFLSVTGNGLGIWPSDNIAMLRALGRDPLVIKETRIGTISGLVDLMDDAASAAGNIRSPVLLLYGAHDELIPAEPMARALANMRRGSAAFTPRCYPNGWHMLLRDNDREIVWQDIASWIADRHTSLLSAGADLRPCGSLAME